MRTPRPGELDAGTAGLPELPPQRLAGLLAAVQSVAAAAAHPARMERLHRTLAEEAAAFLAAGCAAALRADPDALLVRPGTGAAADLEGELLPLEASFAGEALGTGRPAAADDLASAPAAHPLERALGAGPALAVPLPATDGADGVLLAVRRAGADAFSDGEADGLAFLARIAAPLLEAGRRYDRRRDAPAALAAWRRERKAAGWMERMDAAALAAGEALFELDRRTEAMSWAPSAPAVLGLAPAILGQTLESFAGRVHAADAPAVLAALRVSAAPAEPVELRVVNAAGAARRFLLEVQDADPARLRGCVRAAGAAQRARPAAEPALPFPSLPEGLLGALRHEMNNPLAALVGEVQLLRRNGARREGADLDRALDAIHQASRRLCDLAERLAVLERAPEKGFITGAGGLGIAGGGEGGEHGAAPPPGSRRVDLPEPMQP